MARTRFPRIGGLPGLGWPLAGLTVAGLISIPVLVVLASLGFDSQGVWQHLADTVLSTYVKNTLILAFGVAVLSLLIGVACAWVVSLCRFPGQRVFTWALLCPWQCRHTSSPMPTVTYCNSRALFKLGSVTPTTGRLETTGFRK